MCIAGVTMLKSRAELERPLFGLATCPFTAPKVLVASKILQPLQAGQASCNKHKQTGAHSCVHATAASQFDASLRFLPLAEV